jgi:hypothetical protein
MRAEVAKGGIVSPVLFSLYINDILSPPRNFELAMYADDSSNSYVLQSIASLQVSRDFS